MCIYGVVKPISTCALRCWFSTRRSHSNQSNLPIKRFKVQLEQHTPGCRLGWQNRVPAVPRTACDHACPGQTVPWTWPAPTAAGSKHSRSCRPDMRSGMPALASAAAWPAQRLHRSCSHVRSVAVLARSVAVLVIARRSIGLMR